MRLDQAIASRFPGISRRKARELIASGRILVNHRSVRVASRDVNEEADLTIVDENTPRPAILRTTEDWIAVDKPSGLPTQPTRDRQQLSLEEILRAEFRQIYLVHRLDTPTSGVVVFARNRDAAARLSQLFAGREVRKTYLAIVRGTIAQPLEITTPIDGKQAVTRIRPLHDSIVEAEIETGRTHQIRIHLSSIGHPIAGDRRYGGDRAERLMLHAWKLSHPELGELVAPPPPPFELS